MLVRRVLLITMLIGLFGSATELLLLEHYEDTWQLVPIALIAVALALLGWYIARPSRVSTRAFRATMVLFFVAGLAGVVLHMRGAAEFQREIDPGMARWPLLVKVLHAKAPPALAPGLMIQLGLIGFTLTLMKEKST